MTSKLVRPLKEVMAEILKDDPLGRFHVCENDIRSIMVDKLQIVLEKSDVNENSIQKLLEKYPEILVQCLGGGHGRWVLPQKRLGAEYVPDFIIGEKNSGGYFWTAVELESPKANLFNKKGDPSATLNHAIRQILDWRAWLIRNQNYAARSPKESGLGLADISPHLPGLIFVGRRNDKNQQFKERRRQLQTDTGIYIHSYDWLIEVAAARAAHWEGHYASISKIIGSDTC